MQPCPKCNYVRQSSDTNPEWQCPSCGVAYCKVIPATTTSVPAPLPLESDLDDPDVPPAFFRLRNIIILIIAIFLLFKVLPWYRKNNVSKPDFTPGVHIGEPVIRPYEVAGSNFFELNESVLKTGPFDPATNKHWWGMAYWNIGWKFRHITTEGQCRIDIFSLTLEGAIDLPHFTNRSSATEDMKTKWDAFLKGLRIHEFGHWQNGIDATNELEKRLQQISPQPDCATLYREIGAVGDQLVKEYREIDIQYDRRTNHGMTQATNY
jgi:predicted secreted Zn-dependent protease